MFSPGERGYRYPFTYCTLNFDLDLFLKNLDSVHPDVETALGSGRTGEGVDLFKWLTGRVGTHVRHP